MTLYLARLLSIDEASSQFVGIGKTCSGDFDVGTSFAWTTSRLNVISSNRCKEKAGVGVCEHICENALTGVFANSLR